jgi:hypothetical protein
LGCKAVCSRTRARLASGIAAVVVRCGKSITPIESIASMDQMDPMDLLDPMDRHPHPPASSHQPSAISH